MAHIHAKLMMQYAVDAAHHDEPHLLWQYKVKNKEWTSLKEIHPLWEVGTEYRRKPRTININGFEVPEPMRDAPDLGSSYYMPLVGFHRMYDQFYWAGDNDLDRLNSGVCHATKEAAIIHSKALLSFMKQGA